MKPLTERIYHPYWDWEEVHFNMWGAVSDRKKYLQQAIDFTSNHIKYGFYMLKVAQQWTKSCEHNLTNNTQNRKAWIGHAACAYYLGCPEDIVREAWGHLTEDQQRLANKQAEMTIKWWESKHAKAQDRG